MHIKITKANEEKVQELKAHIDYYFERAAFGRSEKTIRFQEAWQYYLCQKPAKLPNETSGYIEPVVRRAVETLRPAILNIFTENESKAVSFRPTKFSPPGMAENIDAVINRIFLQENDGFDMVEKCITEALVSGDTFAKVFTETVITEEEPMTFKKLPLAEFMAILEAYPDTELNRIRQHRKDQTVSGTVVPRKVEDKVRVQHVNFADIFIEGRIEDIKNVPYVCHRRLETVGSLVEQGFDEEEVLMSARIGKDYEALSTYKLINDNVFYEQEYNFSFADEMMREVPIYEHYIWTSIFNKRGKSKMKLLQVVATHQTILKICEVEEMPFVHGCIERIPGSFWGISMYDKLHAEQDTLSRLHRLIEANGMNNTYRRYTAVKGSYDKQSLLNNRPGAIIEVEQPGAVSLFEELPVSQSVFDTIKRVNDTIEKTLLSSTGVDVSGSNVSATAAAITQNNAEMKDKAFARVLSYTFFKPLFELIYNAIKVEYGFPSRADFRVDVNTANDDAVLGSQLVQLGAMFSQWSQAPIPVLQPQGMLEMAKTMTGCSDEELAKYFSIPQPTEEEMMAQQEQMMKQKEMEERQNSLMDAQVQLAIAQVAKTEVETSELIKNGDSKRTREEEESLRDFQKLELQKTEIAYEMANPDSNLTISR
ncbi:MAG: portal protein [Cetobacterium sp.]|uniref:portal protein n=1 Tax=Cetobacterium sp. TaxID=2071632 RepID=UPI003EE6EC4B